jgi:hypothetical protein
MIGILQMGIFAELYSTESLSVVCYFIDERSGISDGSFFGAEFST